MVDRGMSDIRRPTAVAMLALAYAVGVAGTLWDWHDHLIGPGSQPPHLVIDLGGLLVLAVLTFSGKTDLGGGGRSPRSTSSWSWSP